MGRRKKRRIVQREPNATFYKPQGIPLRKLKDATLTYEGLEAIRLADAEGLSQEEGAVVMGVSRPTFSRVLTEARTVVATALTNGWAIRIEGGHYRIVSDGKCCRRRGPRKQKQDESSSNDGGKLCQE